MMFLSEPKMNVTLLVFFKIKSSNYLAKVFIIHYTMYICLYMFFFYHNGIFVMLIRTVTNKKQEGTIFFLFSMF